MLKKLENYQWPGNVREIRNFVERIVVMTPPGTTEISNIPSGMLSEETSLSSHHPEPTDFSQGGAHLSKEVVLSALNACHGHRTKTAEMLGISRRYLQYKIKEYHLSSRCRYEE